MGHKVVSIDNRSALQNHFHTSPTDAAYKRDYTGLPFHKHSKKNFHDIKIKPIAV